MTDSRDETVDQKKAAAYGRASSRLRQEFRERFHELLAEEWKERGIGDYQPRLTPEQRAQAQIEKLYEEFPGLRGGE